MSLRQHQSDIFNIVPLFTNKKLSTIVNVYQQVYKNGGNQGLGDFLRGTLFLFYIGELLNLQIEVDFCNHPMSFFLLNNKSKYKHILYSNIESEIKVYNHMDKEFVTYFIKKLNNCTSSIFFTFTNLQLNINIDKYIQPFISLLQPALSPNHLMKSNLVLRFNNFNILPFQYTVIHIRCGDFYMLNNMVKRNVENQKLQHTHIIYILNYLKNYVPTQQNPIFLISDSNGIKTLICKYFKKILTAIKPIMHLGESNNYTKDSVMFTLLDFYTLCNAKNIISFSPYCHGSGFSKYAALMHNIPFKEIRLEPFFN